jgi:hypothetical protein
MTYKHLLSETVPVVRDSGKLAAQVEFVRWKLEKAEGIVVLFDVSLKTQTRRK